MDSTKEIPATYQKTTYSSAYKPKNYNSNYKSNPQQNRYRQNNDSYNTEETLTPLEKLNPNISKKIKDAQKTALMWQSRGEYKWASDWYSYVKQLWGNASRGYSTDIPVPSNLSSRLIKNPDYGSPNEPYEIVEQLQYTNVGFYKRPIMYQNA